MAGNVPVHNVARWDGATWSALGEGLQQEVDALAVFDDGGGPALFAACRTYRAPVLFKWTGGAWSAVAESTTYEVNAPQMTVAALEGTHPALYVTGSGGSFTTNLLARWDGAEWTWVGPRNSNSVGYGAALFALDEAAGPALYVGGSFVQTGTNLSRGIARWACVPGALAGDLNCDGEVDLSDVNPFVLALSDAAAYAAQFPGCQRINGDCNGDGRVDFGDINAFVELLSGG